MANIEKTPLHAKVEQMLTEARLMLPGAQALLGFQMAVMFTSAFSELPQSSKILHVAALCAIAITVILLMTPAAFHRISYGGNDSEEFHSLGNRFVIAAAVPLAIGLSLDLYVGVSKATDSSIIGTVCAFGAAGLLAVWWFVRPLLLRSRQNSAF